MLNIDLTGLLIFATGDEPFCEGDVKAILQDRGANTCLPSPGEPISYVVVGRKGYEEDKIKMIRPATTQKCFISQESLVELILLDRTPDLSHSSRTTGSHAGL